MTNNLRQRVRLTWQLIVTVAALMLPAAADDPIGRSGAGHPRMGLDSSQLVVDDAVREAARSRTAPPEAFLQPEAFHQNVLQLMRAPTRQAAGSVRHSSADRVGNPFPAGRPASARSGMPLKTAAQQAPAIQLLGTIVPTDHSGFGASRASHSVVEHAAGAPPTGRSDSRPIGPVDDRETLQYPLPSATRLANSDPDVLPWLAPYLDRAAGLSGQESVLSPPPATERMPPMGNPWWNEYVSHPFRQTTDVRETSVGDLLVSALTYSPHILAVQANPQIQQRVWVQEEAAFDWHAYLEATWDDRNDPVGNRLTTGNNSTRFVDQTGFREIGVRRRNKHGGELDFSQNDGWQQNNSSFLLPNPQTTARLELNYTQPLLNGAGRQINTSRTVLAAIATQQAYDDLAETIQTHLLDVTETYWELYLARVLYLQRVRLLSEAEQIDRILRGREAVDAVPRQILRARAELADRKSSVVRAGASIRNAESRIRLLVNEPSLFDPAHLELVPREFPATHNATPSLSSSLEASLWSRPEISHAVRDLRATSVRLNVARNQLLPTLDLILGAYTAGLTGSSGYPGAFGDQFSEGRPGYSVGFVFEIPLGNRAAKARYEQRQLELNQAIQRFRLRIETVFTEVELSVREIETAYREMISRYEALEAAQQEADYLHDRWLMVPGADMTTTLLLEDLLDAQVRLTLAEEAFVRAQVNYSLSLVRVRFTTGTLLNWEWDPHLASSEHQQAGPLPISDPSIESP